MKKLWQMIKGCPLFTILILSGIIVSAGGYAGAALGVYKWDVSFKHPMVQTVLTNERAATGADAGMAEVTTAANATTEDATEAVTEKSSEKATEKVSTEAAKPNKNDKNSKADKKDEKPTKGDKTTEKATEKFTEKNTKRI